MYLSILLLFISLHTQGQISEKHIPITCEDILKNAREARDNKNLYKEMEILEAGIRNECTAVSIAYSSLSLCYLEAGDQSYSDRGSKDIEHRKDYFNEALEVARISANLDSTNKYAFEHKAMAFAGILDVNGLKEKVQLADSVRINAETALKLDPKNDRALHILGRWHYEVSQFGGFMRFFARLFFGTAPKASMDKALEYFQSAVDIYDYPVYHYWVGMTLLKLNNEQLAKFHFEHLLTLENNHHNDEFFKEKALDQLKEIE